MFCHKCGTQIAEGADFCHKCGTKVVYDTVDSQTTNQLSVMLTKIDPAYKIRVINLVCKLTGLGLAEANKLVEQVPALLKIAVAPTEAESIKEAFTNAGAVVVFADQNGVYVEITLHCKKCGAELDDDSNFCPTCGCPVCAPANSNEGNEIKPASHFQDSTYSQGNTPFPSDTLQCPNCHSTDLIPTTETTTNVSGGGYRVGKGCCGWILFGPVGLLCGLCGTGVKSQSQTKTYWMCRSCGNKFRSPEDLKTDEMKEAEERAIVSGNILIASLFLLGVGNYFADHDISFLGFPSWLYITLGKIGMVLGGLGLLIWGLLPGIGDFFGKSGKANALSRKIFFGVWLFLFISLLMLGIVLAMAMYGRDSSEIPAGILILIILGALGTFLSAVMFVYNCLPEDKKDALTKRYEPVIEKIKSIFWGKR